MKPIILGVAALVISCASVINAQNMPERNVRLGHGIAADHPLGIASVKYAEIMARLSGGKFKVKVYPATQLGSEAQMIAAVRGGVQEIAIVASAPVATIIKGYLLFDLPFLFQNEKEAEAVLDGKLGQKLLDLTREKNMIGLCYWENGFRQVTNSKRSVATLDEMAGHETSCHAEFRLYRCVQGAGYERHSDALHRALHGDGNQGH